MNDEFLYPICTILYKIENSDGWYYAIMSGEENECRKRCDEIKKKNNWYDYECYVSSRCVLKKNIPFQNTMPEANYIHRATDLIYNPFDNKFYYSEETMPYPKIKKRTTSFKIIVKGEGEDEENIWEPNDTDDFESGTDITISFGHKKDKIITIAEDLLSDIPKFINRLKLFGYANLSIEEFTYTKFLAWEVQDKVRFIVQYYGGFNIETEIDKLITKELFYKEFQNLNLTLQKYIEKHNKLFNAFKSQEKFAQSLKWEFDKATFNAPQEYTCLNWNINKSKEFKAFQSTIKEKSEEHTIDFDTKERFNCYLANDYYYWCCENKIFRKLFYIYKTKDIIRFINSKDFEYKKGMSLTDIYNQLLDKGYHQAISCEFKNKKVLIYANGQVESKDATKEEKNELEQIIKNLANNISNKDNLTVSDFVTVLKEYIKYVSYRENKMKL